MKIAIVLGTRPEIIKMSPIIRECQKRQVDFFILHSTQHYSEDLDRVFFDELELPQPKYNLGVGPGTHAEETGKILIGIEGVLLKEKPDIVLVEGDTNTVLAGALAAAKLHIKVGHVEAGLRSYDRNMPEELNRILTDHCSDFLFAPTRTAEKILINEGIPKEKIFVTGNTIVDVVYQNLKLAKEKSNVLERLKIRPGEYFLLTLHRQENVDDKERFQKILKGIEMVFQKYRFPIIYPIHPRSQKMSRIFNLEIPNGLKTIEPVGYMDFLRLEKNTALVLTDSGGIQEETCVMRVPCVTIRDNTERPETVEVGSNIVAGIMPEGILRGADEMIERKRDCWQNPFGDGRAGERIVDIIMTNK